jgi:hypothetical protein
MIPMKRSATQYAHQTSLNASFHVRSDSSEPVTGSLDNVARREEEAFVF